MAVLCAPKQKKQCRVGWNSHATELYSDSSDICLASQPHHHQSWSFPATREVGSSIKQRVVHLPVSPHKKQTNSGGTADHILLDYDNDTLPYLYHLDPQAYALTMARDMEDAATAPRNSHIDTYLAESLRHEGRGDALSLTSGDCFYRCSCIVTAHLCSPTHIIQHWNSNYFDKIPLWMLGLWYQVGHLVGKACAHPRPAFGSHFMIIDTNSIHNVALDFCHCLREHPLAIQLQCAWLFPGTVLEPHIVVTVAALEQFQMLTFMGKLSAYEYYHSSVRLSDNTGTKTPLDNFEAFICIVREWSFIRLLKRGGISNDTSGWEAAKPVSCAVECLACPRPGINIPVKLDPNVPTAWEDTLFVGVDANFKLERFEVSTLAASGVGGVICMCHKLKLPLQVEMDYGYLSAVRRFSGIPRIMTTYDIACQWSINLEDRIKVYGPDMAPPLCNMLYLVLKFHLPGHIKACQKKYCMSFHIHVGNNDSEAPEWSWAISNGVAALTWEMSPGHQHEKLDQHFSDVNWQKNISMGNSLLQKIKDTVPNAAEFESHFERFMMTLPTDDVAKWTTMVEAWEADREQFNPFAWIVASKLEAAMHLQLAHEDAQDELAGLEGNQLYVMSPKDMIAQGVQIEASQIARMNKDLGEHSTDLQRAQVLEKSNWLCRRQEVHMLVVHGLQIHDSKGNSPSVPTYSQPLYLPSTVLLHHPCDDIVGFDLLHTICGHLLALAKGYKDADAMMLMQKEWLKCHKTTRDLNMCITQVKYYYRNVQQCLMTLSARTGEHSWQSQLRGLEDSDVHRISDSTGMSWIWYAAHLGDVPGSVNEYLRIEWCKARTWVHRWREECKLVNANMQHVKHTLEHDTNLWLSRAQSGMEGGAFITAGEGAAAYAKCQAVICITIKSSFEQKWSCVEEWIMLGETDESVAVDNENPFIE
ncbi:hypothetical protein IW261DRAFT_1551980 [Armillaria novae-zelandiae]|uniref:CxC2-like cysteine cluster KDZ transposase-associated domain-containing protein n=1 Tax=Armillaria novae-zelandiae TaxID=153914 RepID=A0AA39P4Z4_9AGAR|nr:hypothetical protein IW261DRAFT_1551980 [Armillaria novae-zelandiae]